jgi:hypothetical protein
MWSDLSIGGGPYQSPQLQHLPCRTPWQTWHLIPRGIATSTTSAPTSSLSYPVPKWLHVLGPLIIHWVMRVSWVGMLGFLFKSASRPLVGFGVLNDNLIKPLISFVKCIIRFLMKVQMYSLIHLLKYNCEANGTMWSTCVNHQIVPYWRIYVMPSKKITWIRRKRILIWFNISGLLITKKELISATSKYWIFMEVTWS